MTVGKTLVGLTAVALMAAGPAFASADVDQELAEMRQMVEGLKQRVEAQEEQLGHQSELLQDAQKVVRETQQEQDALSSLGEFWNAVDVGMSAATSYAWNFNNPDGGGPSGFAGNTGGGGYPFHPDHNSFQVDQIWLDIAKEATAESRAGFGFSILYGNTAAFLGEGAFDRRFGILTFTGGGDSTSDYYVHEAYIDYLAPIGEGVNVRAGKFATVVGMETGDASENWNITRGNVFNLFQPIDHVGLLTSTDIGPVSLTAGLVNTGTFLGNSSPDNNKDKAYIWGVGVSPMDGTNLGATVIYGADGLTGAGNVNGHKTGLLDVVLSHDADAFSAWINADYIWQEGSNQSAWGIAVAGMVPITDELSAAVRGEYVTDIRAGSAGGNFPSGAASQFGIAGPNRTEIWGVTGTLAYMLAENLTLKSELRWDIVHEGQTGPAGGGEAFAGRTAGGGHNGQLVGLAQLVYAF